MSKSCCFAVVLAVICLPVILLSSEADAQPTVGGATTCGAFTLQEVANDIRDVKMLLKSKTTDGVTVEPPKQILVSALMCENFQRSFCHVDLNRKLSFRRGTARRSMAVEKWSMSI